MGYISMMYNILVLLSSNACEYPYKLRRHQFDSLFYGSADPIFQKNKKKKNFISAEILSWICVCVCVCVHVRFISSTMHISIKFFIEQFT